jgi:regulatory protein
MSAAEERPRIPVKDRALRLLSVRSRSKSELRGRLLRAGYHPSEIESAVADLEGVGLIDDERFAQEVAAKDRRRGLGRRAGLASLRGKGVDRALAERVTAETQSDDEEARAIEVARSRVGRLKNLDPPVARRRLLGFLLRRGYEGETARTAARRVLEEEEAG